MTETETETERERVAEEILRFDPSVPIERASMPPSSWYCSAAIADLERERVFARRWLPVVRAEAVSEPGSVASGCVAEEPWLIVRDREGELRAFHNTCRHKGNILVDGASSSSSSRAALARL